MASKLTTEEFITKARDVHGNVYGYNDCTYIGSIVKAEITCKIHGNFMQKAGNHLAGKGCPICGQGAATLKNSGTAVSFSEKASKLHNNKYTYTNAKYINANTKVTITCKIHGDFTQTPGNHLSGKGCAKCAKQLRPLRSRSTTPQFIEKALKIHGDTYDYTNTQYVKSEHAVTIGCRVHGAFTQIAFTHLQGSGCPTCGALRSCASPYYNNKPHILYYFKISNVWKIGVTSIPFNRRYKGVDLANISELRTWEFSTGKEAYLYEQDIITKYSKYSYSGLTPFTGGTGTTECFTEDIYKLHLKEQNEH